MNLREPDIKEIAPEFETVYSDLKFTQRLLDGFQDGVPVYAEGDAMDKTSTPGTLAWA